MLLTTNASPADAYEGARELFGEGPQRNSQHSFVAMGRGNGLDFLKSFDVYRDIPKDLTEQTLTGAIGA